MNKADFVEIASQKAEISKKDMEAALKAILETITETLAKKDTISFLGFGTFSTSQRAERVARVPRTGEEVKVPAATVVKFKVGKNLKDAVKNSK